MMICFVKFQKVFADVKQLIESRHVDMLLDKSADC